MNDKKEDTTKEMEEILKDLENESAKGGKMSHKDRFGKHSDDNNEKKDIDKDIDKDKDKDKGNDTEGCPTLKIKIMMKTISTTRNKMTPEKKTTSLLIKR